MQAAGFVLVGGKSSRMGRDKALLPGKFRYMVQDVAEAIKVVTNSVTLIGEPSRYRALNYPCIPDLRPALGPLSGIEAALASNQSELNLILACDMPAVQSAQFAALLECAELSPADCIVTRDSQGQIHPLCATYKRRCLPIVQRRLDEGQLSLMGLLEELQTEYVSCHSVLENLNTPDDWASWKLKQSDASHTLGRALT